MIYKYLYINNIFYLNIHVCVCIYIYFIIYMCTHIYYVTTNFYFGCD